MTKPYDIYLSITQLGDQFRAELFTEQGGTDGQLLPAKWEGVDEWFPFLSESAARIPSVSAETVGGTLFEYLLGNKANSAKWAEVCQRAQQEGRQLRLLIDSSIPDEAVAKGDRIHTLPYGLLFQDGFLFRRMKEGQPEIVFIRVHRRCTLRPLRLEGRPLRILFAAAEPVEPKEAFGCPHQVAQILQAFRAAPLAEAFDVSLCTPDGPKRLRDLREPGGVEAFGEAYVGAYCRTTAGSLQSALKQGQFDIFHLLAHGSGTSLLLCDGQGHGVAVPAGDLALWCRASPGLQLAFLQACRASETGGRGSFGGLAQRLLNPHEGNLAAVIASSYPLLAQHSTDAALAFYRGLAQQTGGGEVVLARNLPQENWCWALLELWVRLNPMGKIEGALALEYHCPYRGLAQFEERDADIFFGRAAEVGEVLDSLRDEPALVIVGDTGSGKSSLLRAGVAYQVRMKGLAGRPGWQVVVLRPSYEPSRALLNALPPREGAEPSQPSGTALTAEQWAAHLKERLRAVCQPGRPLLVLLDQFEEMFTLCQDPAQRLGLAQALMDFADEAKESFRVVVAVRSDYLGAAAGLARSLAGGRKPPIRPWVLPPPSEHELHEMIVTPARRCGYRFEGAREAGSPGAGQGVDQRVLNDFLAGGGMGGTAGAAAANQSAPMLGKAPLPLLEFALKQLWLAAVRRDRDTDLFTHADYDAIGGLGGALATYAQDVYDRLASTTDLGVEAQILAGRIFARLVGYQGTRQPLARDQLLSRVLERVANAPSVLPGGPAAAPPALPGPGDDSGGVTKAREVIDQLVEARLLTVRTNPDAPGDDSRALVELAHEVLIERWPLLKSWLNSGQEARLLEEGFQRDAGQWEGGIPGTESRSRTLLPSYHRSRKYLGWVDNSRSALPGMHEDFVKALRLFVRSRELRVKLTLFGLALLVLATTGFGVTTLVMWRIAVAAGERLERQSYVVLMNSSQRAWEDGRLQEAQQFVAEADKRAEKRPWRGFEYYYWKMHQTKDQDTLPASPSGNVNTVAFSPDGSVLATGTDLGWVELWSVAGKARTRLKSFETVFEDVHTVAFSPDGSLLAAAGSGRQTKGLVKVWKTGNWLEHSVLALQEGIAEAVAFSRVDGTLAVGGGLREEQPTSAFLKLWRPGQPEGAAIALPDPGSVINSLAFDPTGTLLASGGEDGSVLVWDVAGQRRAAALKAHAGAVAGVAFAEDGTLASGGKDGILRLWRRDADAWQERAPGMLQHGRPVGAVAFAPGSRTLASGSRQIILHGQVIGEIKLWDVTTGEQRLTLKGHVAPVHALAFASHGNLLVSAAYQDGERGTVQFWDWSGEEAILPLSNSPTSLALSPDGEMLAASDGPALRLWDGRTRRPLDPPLKGDTDEVRCLAWAPATTAYAGRKILASAGHDGTVRAWERQGATWRELGPFRGHTQRVNALTFSPQLQRLASASDDTTVRVWDLSIGQSNVAPLQGEKEVSAVAFSPDGHLLACGHADGKIVLWFTRDWTKREVPEQAHKDKVNFLAFSPDGKLLASAGDDHSIVVWRIQGRTAQRAHELLGHLEAVFQVTFSPTGTVLASASSDGTVRLWDGELDVTVERLILKGFQGGVYCLAFSPGEEMLITGSDTLDGSGIIRFWEAPRQGQ